MKCGVTERVKREIHTLMWFGHRKKERKSIVSVVDTVSTMGATISEIGEQSTKVYERKE